MANEPMPEGLGFPDLKAVMLDTDPMAVMKWMPADAKDDLFYGNNDRLKYAKGAVAEQGGHVTLLFGIHPTPSFRRNVDAVLRDWKPEPIQILEVGSFPPSKDADEKYSVIIAHVKPTQNLLQAHARLETLDHTSSYPDYKPHITLAYVNENADVASWISTLGEVYNGKTVPAKGLDYGSDS